MKGILSKKQQRAWECINGYLKKHGVPPTVLELCDLLKVKSLRTVTQYLEILERKGYIIRRKYQKRGIEIIGGKRYFNPATINVPVFGSAGCDNMSILAETEYDDFVPVSKNLLANKDSSKIVGIRAVGHSMEEAGINDGDIVLVEKTESVSPNERVVAIIDDIAVIKRISFSDKAVILNPVTNKPGYRPIIMERNFKIYGLVIDTIRTDNLSENIQLIYEPGCKPDNSV